MLLSSILNQIALAVDHVQFDSSLEAIAAEHDADAAVPQEIRWHTGADTPIGQPYLEIYRGTVVDDLLPRRPCKPADETE